MSEADDTAHDAPQVEQLDALARFGSGLATIYDALDRLVALRGLEDAALVVEVAPLGRQVLRAGRRPLRDDDHGLLTRDPGLYVVPAEDDGGPADDPLVGELMVRLAELGLRHDVARLVHEQGAA
ncbi:MAG TPA: hypothetical protein VFZ17_13895 [Acidimicrobiia bacterium]|nr:hypothetical protein [Acidimicrobiia bacterium]